MTERFGSKRTWIASIVLFAIGSALCALATSAGEPIAFLVLQGSVSETESHGEIGHPIAFAPIVAELTLVALFVAHSLRVAASGVPACCSPHRASGPRSCEAPSPCGRRVTRWRGGAVRNRLRRCAINAGSCVPTPSQP